MLQKLKEKYKASLGQFIKFGLVGLSNTVISYVIYAGLVFFGVNYIVSNVIAFIVSVLNSFYWNNKYVFKEDDLGKRSALLTLIKTFMAYGFSGLILSNILLYLWVDILNVSKYIAPLINLIITIPVNFVLNKLWAFKGK